MTRDIQLERSVDATVHIRKDEYLPKDRLYGGLAALPLGQIASGRCGRGAVIAGGDLDRPKLAETTPLATRFQLPDWGHWRTPTSRPSAELNQHVIIECSEDFLVAFWETHRSGILNLAKHAVFANDNGLVFERINFVSLSGCVTL